MKTKDLIKLLKTKPQDQDVEFMVVDANTTNIVVMELTDNVVDMMKLMKAFKPRGKQNGNS